MDYWYLIYYPVGAGVCFLAEYFDLRMGHHVNYVNPVKTIVVCPRWDKKMVQVGHCLGMVPRPCIQRL